MSLFKFTKSSFFHKPISKMIETINSNDILNVSALNIQKMRIALNHVLCYILTENIKINFLIPYIYIDKKRIDFYFILDIIDENKDNAIMKIAIENYILQNISYARLSMYKNNIQFIDTTIQYNKL